jgi:hypothetical protein
MLTGLFDFMYGSIDVSSRSVAAEAFYFLLDQKVTKTEA